MDLYISSLLLGAAGLGVMALGGLGLRGHAGSGARGHGHASGHGHGHGHGHAAGHVHGVQHSGHAHVVGSASSARSAASNTLWTITSPRFLFSLALGFGFAGLRGGFDSAGTAFEHEAIVACACALGQENADTLTR